MSIDWLIAPLNLEDVHQPESTLLDLVITHEPHNYCYLLRSISRPNRTYFGVTQDLSTRIRQHNGEITGGAKTTRTGRPWKIIAYISGFINRTEALKFEWRVHHPGIRWRGLSGRIKVLSLVINQEKWLIGSEYGHRQLTVNWIGSNHCPVNESCSARSSKHLKLKSRNWCIERHSGCEYPSNGKINSQN